MLLLGACGDGDDDDGSDTGTVADDSFAAKDAVPDLGSLGFTVAEEQPDPGALAGQDVYRARFAKQGSSQAVVTVLYLFPDTSIATDQFGQLSEALKNPPPGFVGSEASWAGSEAPGVGDEQKGYVTASADSSGNKVWTDVYRFGRLVAIVQYLDKGDSDQLSARTSVAEAIGAKVP